MEKFEDRFGRLKIPLETLEDATEKFNEKYEIGYGGYGKIYKASLPMLNQDRRLSGHPIERKPVAIKRRSSDSKQGRPEFESEITLLSYLKHKNVISLVGYCDEGDELILVYQYASNKSFDTYIKTQSVYSYITWAQRLKICSGVARGLEYLHGGGKHQMRSVHRDIKSANVLLDQNWQPMIGDFGLSIRAPRKKKSISTKAQIVGTPGYIDPHYQKTSSLSEKVDVYSFGVFLSEVLLGELVSPHVPQYKYSAGKLISITETVNERIKEQFSFLDAFSDIAFKCLQDDPNNRPNMTEIVKEIEKLLLNQITTLNLRISLEVIKEATNNFDESNIIGWGESARVYKGVLSRDHGYYKKTVAAVKHFKHRVEDETDIMTDILRLGDFKHENIIDFLGFHNHENQKFLIYEYAYNGSLDKYLSNTSNKSSLTWKQSLKICLGAAQGLYFIHTSEPQGGVAHGDFKSSNILLTRNWTAKISNFGLSKRTHKNGITFLISSGAGTLGYCDPAYTMTGILTKASDVYSFGFVLFEVLVKSLVLENDRHNGDQQVDERRKLNKRVDVNKYDNFSLSVSTFLNIARKCVQKKPEERPTMGQVVQELTIASDFETNEWDCANQCGLHQIFEA